MKKRATIIRVRRSAETVAQDKDDSVAIHRATGLAGEKLCKYDERTGVLKQVTHNSDAEAGYGLYVSVSCQTSEAP